MLQLKEKKKHNVLFKEYFTNFQSPSDICKTLCKTERIKNEDQVYLIKQVLDKIKKKMVENVAKGSASKTETNEKIVHIVERILCFNQQGQGLNILTPNQMFCRLRISLAQLKAGNNPGKLKDEIRQLFYSLYRSKKVTKQLYKSLVDII